MRRSVSRPAIGRSTARALRSVAGLEAAVLVPVAVRQLDEADAGLDEAPGQQALPAEVGGRRVVEAVQALRRRRLARQVHHAGERALHAEGQLVRLDDALDAGVDLLALEQRAVQRLDEVELEALGRGVEPGVLDVADAGLGDGHALVADAGPLVGRRQEGAAVVLAPPLREVGLIVMKPGRFSFSVPRP